MRTECVVQFYTVMGKATQRRIDFVLKKKDDTQEVEEDPLAPAADPLPLLENLPNNMLVNIESDILEKYNYDDVIDDFRRVKDRNADL